MDYGAVLLRSGDIIHLRPENPRKQGACLTSFSVCSFVQEVLESTMLRSSGPFGTRKLC